MMIALTVFTAFLLLVSITAAFYTEAIKRFMNPTFAYYAFSLFGHLMALPLLLICAAIFIAAIHCQQTPIAAMSGIAVLLFLSTLWRAWKGSQDLNKILPGDNNAGAAEFICGGLLPFKIAKKGVTRIADIAYGEAGVKNLLDIYVPETRPADPMPVMIHIHGGAWSIGHKQQQGQPLIQHMTAKGWLCVDINYRLGPKHRFPVLFEDVMRAIAWVKTNIAEYGGDPNFVILTGGSAGGHLTALAALMPNNADFKTGFDSVDCTVQAAVPVYGVYDFIDRTGAFANYGQAKVEGFLTEKTMPGPRATHEDFWDMVSPLRHVRADAPPFLILHGRQDALASFPGAEIFTKALSDVSKDDVIFAPIPGGQHAYDAAGAPPTAAHVRLVDRFLTGVYARYVAQKKDTP
ncbi:MAG: alpha/beta hydrolase fold domain-containing protein [Maricaulaceae bacterium]